MNEVQHAVASKMQYIIDEIGNGPLSSIEEQDLIETLKMRSDNESIWGVAIKTHFDKGNTDHSALIQGLASQCKDDIFTMICIVGLKGSIYLLRAYKEPVSNVFTFILCDPNDDTGNDDGILDKQDMTQEQANKWNAERRANQNDCRWIRLTAEKNDHLCNDKNDYE